MKVDDLAVSSAQLEPGGVKRYLVVRRFALHHPCDAWVSTRHVKTTSWHVSGQNGIAPTAGESGDERGVAIGIVNKPDLAAGRDAALNAAQARSHARRPRLPLSVAARSPPRAERCYQAALPR